MAKAQERKFLEARFYVDFYFLQHLKAQKEAILAFEEYFLAVKALNAISQEEFDSNMKICAEAIESLCNGENVVKYPDFAFDLWNTRFIH